MGVLTPEAFVKHFNECLDYARKHKLGIFGANNSEAFINKIDKEYDELFKEKK